MSPGGTRLSEGWAVMRREIPAIWQVEKEVLVVFPNPPSVFLTRGP